jgi:hypothetical protein
MSGYFFGHYRHKEEVSTKQRFARDVDFGNGVLMWEQPSRLHLEHGVSELEEAYFMCYTYYTQTWHLFDVGDEARR